MVRSGAYILKHQTSKVYFFAIRHFKSTSYSTKIGKLKIPLKFKPTEGRQINTS